MEEYVKPVMKVEEIEDDIKTISGCGCNVLGGYSSTPCSDSMAGR